LFTQRLSATAVLLPRARAIQLRTRYMTSNSSFINCRNRTYDIKLFQASLFPQVRLAIISSSHRLMSTRNESNDNNDDKEDSDSVKKSALYTRTGDSGTSMLFNGERRSKSDRVFKALGDQDELNASIGLATEYSKISNNGLDDKLIEIQCRLFDLGAAVATPVQTSSASKISRTKFDAHNTKILEGWIDALDAQLPPLKNFVIPSGGLCSVHLQHSRTVCRRAERSVVALVRDGQADEEVGRYLNRLSDFLFVAARYAAKHDNKEEIIWRK